MRKFGIVLKYELREFFSSKGFMIFTVLLAVLGAGALFLPRVIDMSDFTGVKIVGNTDDAAGEAVSDEEKEQFAWLDLSGEGILREEVLQSFFPNAVWHEMESEEALKEGVEAGYDAGFIVTGATAYEYVVYNKSMTDGNAAMFDEAMKLFYRMDYCERNGLELGELDAVYYVPITVTEEILNKDTGSNYWYCYFLVIIVFMLITLYGTMIATSVTSEKSNRAIEVLVTSTTPNSLLFGKVIAGAIGGVLQIGVILGSVLISYEINRQQWGCALDMFLHVPGDVLLTFAVFGLGGYLFYAFCFGAMGALCSKTEDVSRTVSGLTVIIMVVYFFSLIQLMDVESVTIRVLSFLPISSYSTMFARIAMGTVAPWEIVLSLLILIVSIIGTGILGARLYRMGTLRYGNPIRLGTALKDLKKEKKPA